VLAEFVVAVTLKIAEPLDIEAAWNSVENYQRSWTVFDLTGLIILEAIRGVREHRFSYWDAQIWATARLNQVPVVLSEDFASGSTVEGITFTNPFEDDLYEHQSPMASQLTPRPGLNSYRNGGKNLPEKNKIITFPAGLPGLPAELTRFELVALAEDSPFFFLQSLQDENVGLLLINLFTFFPDYEFNFPEEEAQALGIAAPD